MKIYSSSSLGTKCRNWHEFFKKFQNIIGMGAAWDYPQKTMEKFSATFFSNFLGANFENLNYTSQIYMQHPYFGL